jgi:hypothetical protein
MSVTDAIGMNPHPRIIPMPRSAFLGRANTSPPKVVAMVAARSEPGQVAVARPRRARPARKGKPNFDYAAFPDAIQRNLREMAAAIRTRLDIRRRIGSAVDAVQVSLWLHDVHRCLGKEFFQPFLRAEFEWSKAGATRFTRAATFFKHLEPDSLDRFDATALYVLSAERVPQSAR